MTEESGVVGNSYRDKGMAPFHPSHVERMDPIYQETPIFGKLIKHLRLGSGD
jgi:hypothetical protein